MKLSEKLRGHSLYVSRVEMNSWMEDAEALEDALEEVMHDSTDIYLKRVAREALTRATQ